MVDIYLGLYYSGVCQTETRHCVTECQMVLHSSITWSQVKQVIYFTVLIFTESSTCVLENSFPDLTKNYYRSKTWKTAPLQKCTLKSIFFLIWFANLLDKNKAYVYLDNPYWCVKFNTLYLEVDKTDIQVTMFTLQWIHSWRKQWQVLGICGQCFCLNPRTNSLRFVYWT